MASADAETVCSNEAVASSRGSRSSPHLLSRYLCDDDFNRQSLQEFRQQAMMQWQDR